MATAPGLNERPVLRWWCRSFPDSLAAHGALKDQQKMAPVYRTYWESRLPLTRSLCDFETKVFIRWRASVARPILGNKATANQSPVPKLRREESYSKGRLRVSNGLCKDSIMMQSTKPSNSDF